ncbi:MAG: molecular chaperone DnaJ [Deltaproteobacteria bacterium]|nr:molecular chaperone DnaJ [Deltaproteobacteria bacterium]MBI3295497.1 molecular chaperone DnaJ [Deltaproteobacteria bacterium]
MKRDYYEILGVVRGVSEDDLKKAYRKAAVQYHPDRNPGDKTAEEKFKEVNEAYQVLSDPKRRSAYDQFGHSAFQGGGFEQGFSSATFTDIFDNIFGDIFGASGGGGPSNGVDLRYNLEITFEEAAFGVERQITFEKAAPCSPCQGSGAKPGTKPKTCRNCKGTGQIRLNQGFFTLARTCTSCFGRGTTIEEKCPECRGKGRVQRPHSVSVKIPAGVDAGQRLRLRGEGEIGESGDHFGDLFVVIHVKEHALFKRDQESIHLEFPISFVQAALGAELEVPILGGASSMKVPAGTQSGEVFRLKGKGIKRLNGSGYGDQFVRILVETPTNLSGKQRDLLREFEKMATAESQPGITSFLNKLRDLL